MMSVEEFMGKTVWDILASKSEIYLYKNHSTPKHVNGCVCVFLYNLNIKQILFSKDIYKSTIPAIKEFYKIK